METVNKINTLLWGKKTTFGLEYPKFELHFLDHEFDEPKYSIKESKIHSVNYAAALRVNVGLLNKETGEYRCIYCEAKAK